MTVRQSLIHAFGIAMLAIAPAYALQDDTLAELMKKAEKSRFILVGEMHGTREVPALVADLAERWSKPREENGVKPALVVALEYPRSEAADLNAYFHSDGGPEAKKRLLDSPLWSRSYQDGRSSEAMFDLIEGVRALAHNGRKVKLAPFDQNAKQAKLDASRDKSMAHNLRAIVKANPSARVLALTGNYHARKSVGAPWNAKHRFMGNYLKDLAPYSIDVSAMRGSYWGCFGQSAADCKVERFGDASAATQPEGIYADEAAAASGYDQTLMLNLFVVSLPAKKAE